MPVEQWVRAELAKHVMRMVLHLSGGDGSVLTHRVETLKSTRCVRTPKIKGQWGQQTIVWTIDGDEHEYTTCEWANKLVELGAITKPVKG